MAKFLINFSDYIFGLFEFGFQSWVFFSIFNFYENIFELFEMIAWLLGDKFTDFSICFLNLIITDQDVIE